MSFVKNLSILKNINLENEILGYKDGQFIRVGFFGKLKRYVSHFLGGKGFSDCRKDHIAAKIKYFIEVNKVIFKIDDILSLDIKLKKIDAHLLTFYKNINTRTVTPSLILPINILQKQPRVNPVKQRRVSVVQKKQINKNDPPQFKQPKMLQDISDFALSSITPFRRGGCIALIGSAGLMATGSVKGSVIYLSGLAALITAASTLDETNERTKKIVQLASIVTLVGLSILMLSGSKYATAILLTGGGVMSYAVAKLFLGGLVYFIALPFAIFSK